MSEIEVKHLSKTFEQKGVHVDALKDINLTIGAGDIYGIIGMSGAGKTTVLKFLEDMDFFCVDNLPPALITKFSQLCFEQDGSIDKVALGIDIRGGKLFKDLFKSLEDLKTEGYDYEILFLDASDSTLIKRSATPPLSTRTRATRRHAWWFPKWRGCC